MNCLNHFNCSIAVGACVRSRKTSCEAETVWLAASVTHCIQASDELDSSGPPECPQSNVWCGRGPRDCGRSAPCQLEHLSDLC